jgi:hypothetical protein
MARPSKYSPVIAATICSAIADGVSVRKICARDDMPDKATVMRWLAEHEEFRRQYAAARELQADLLFDEALEIADDASRDTRVVDGSEGAPVAVVDHEHISRSRLRVDTRKWAAGKLAPKKYGDRVALTGADGGPIRTVETIVPARVIDDLREIFGSDLPQPTPAAPPRRDRVLRARAQRRRKSQR